MPDRSVKMKRRILGFQRRVWWPKWTPASSSSRIETTGTDSAPFGWVGLLPAGLGGTGALGAGTATGLIRRVGCENRGILAGCESDQRQIEFTGRDAFRRPS